MKSLRKHWPWLLILVIPLWILGVVSELMDARLLAQEGVQVQGRIVNAEWITARRGRRLLVCEIAWNHEGQECQRRFNMPEAQSLDYVDPGGQVTQPLIEIRCAKFRPEIAALVIDPPDPWWVHLILAGVGFCVVSGLVVFQIRRLTAGRPA